MASNLISLTAVPCSNLSFGVHKVLLISQCLWAIHGHCLLLIMSTVWNTYKCPAGLAMIAAVCPWEKCERLPETGAWLGRNGMSVLHHPEDQ